METVAHPAKVAVKTFTKPAGNVSAESILFLYLYCNLRDMLVQILFEIVPRKYRKSPEILLR